MATRQIVERNIVHGPDESIRYALTTTPWGSSPTSVTVVVYRESDESDVTATVMPGSPTPAGDVIALPPMSSLTLGERYRVEIRFEAGGNIFETYGIVRCG